MKHDNYVPLIECTRASIVESVHFGAIAVVDSKGTLVASCGDPETVTFMRSSSKPLQVLPFVEAGGVSRFDLTDPELAIMCASHSGTDEQVAVIESIQDKTGIRQENLLCGTQPVWDEPTWAAMQKRGELPTPNRHTCSGKHSGFLAYALLRNLPLEDYLNPDHPIQRTILQVFAEMCSFPPENVHIGIDGCSAPVFGLPLYNAALGYARLCDPQGLPSSRAAACRVVCQAMAKHPDMVGGPGRFDTLSVQAASGKIIVKEGAEGYQSVGILPGALGKGSPGLGICFKMSDGDLTSRTRPAVTLEILRQLGLKFPPGGLELLKDFDRRPIYNWRKIEVGELRPCFTLEKHSSS